jgi:hypothetical protein
MKQFVLLFRQSPVTLSNADQSRRRDEVRNWALRQRADGRALDGRILEDESHTILPNADLSATKPDHESPLTAIAFLEATSFQEAVEIAQTHPGVNYGVSVEVRGWSLPPATPPAQVR